MKVGDIVQPEADGSPLRSGNIAYPYAIVVQVKPLVLVSAQADMRWSSTLKDHKFNVIGTAKPEALARCMTRLEA
jgi:hypothetical protein